ncbi:MAG: ParB/RepB/Spo0J family partition protein [Eubacteriales bacterium]|nr:ParB/RepB/Spo0J family partition protein [Eubacteriales bacterium]MDD4324139.1 ParB/RepB/Spo0J family partition protein [Eubacteriales bacterium]MDD4540742.1 ParB/RepB/Spo0J family partition protein [Eubacteriales bacterium]
MTEAAKNSKTENPEERPKRKSRGLGRGLDALFEPDSVRSDSDISPDQQQVVMININDLVQNRAQPRKDFDPDKLAELAESIKNQGVIQPLIVAANDTGKPPYTIVAGERRWRASRLAGLSEVPCLVRQLDNLEMQQQALIENVVREDLNPIEEAVAYEELAKEYGITQETLARALGKSRSAISNTIRLLQLPDLVQSYVRSGQISAGHARTLLPLSPQEQEATAKLIKDKQLSVRETEELVKKILNPVQKVKPGQSKNNAFTLHAKKMEDEMTRAMGTKVRINSKGGKGNIVISYSSADELERIIDKIITER